MTSFSFVHCADIHLDSPLKGLSRRDGHAPERIRVAVRQAFEKLIDDAVDAQVSFVVIAGDLYDGDWRDFNTGLYFVRQMGKLREAGIRVYVCFGNHDAASEITRSLSLPDNVHVFPSKHAGTFRLEDIGVSIHGRSYPEKAVTENLVPSYPVPDRNSFNIGLLHTGLGGLGGHMNYAPCTCEELVAFGYDYWALGHVHGARILNRNPWVVYPGNIQGRNIRETGPKGYARVEVNDGKVTCRNVAIDVVRWHRTVVDLDGCADKDDSILRLSEQITRDLDEHADGRLLVCRIEFCGATTLHGWLHREQDWVLAQAQAIAEGIGDERAWIESLEIKTTSRQRTVVSDDSLMHLRELLNTTAGTPDFRKLMDDEINRLIASLPHEVRTNSQDGLLATAGNREFGTLVDDAVVHVLGRLTGTDD